MALRALHSCSGFRFSLSSTTLLLRRPFAITMQNRQQSTLLITPAELASALSKNPPLTSTISTAPRTIPLCASWFLPNDSRSGHGVFLESHVPGARFFDLDAVKDQKSPYPHMLPSAAEFASAMSGLGIRRDDEIVVYDSKEQGIFSAPRVAWTFRVFGHPAVRLLNNFKLWVEQSYPTESGEPAPLPKTEYPVPELDANKVVAFEEMKMIALDHGKEGAEGVQILDARSKGRWAGTDPEPRPGLPSGHMPGSISVPVPELLDPTSKTLLPADKLREVFLSKGIDPERPIIASCGTGVTAAVIDAALTEANFGDASKRRLYDGSWTEWAQRATVAEGLIKKA